MIFFISTQMNQCFSERELSLFHPKTVDTKSVSDYRPISIISCAYKLIARVLSYRLNKDLLDTAVPNQLAFV